MTIYVENLAMETRVRLCETGDSGMNGSLGSIIGIASEYDSEKETHPLGSTFYIVLLDKPFRGRSGIVMSEACLEEVSDKRVLQ